MQKFGTFLSGMIMPNIAAFIAWGFITAFFIETGWTPVAGLGGFGVDATGAPNIGLVGPMIRYMLPLLIAMQGGRMVYGVRGGGGRRGRDHGRDRQHRSADVPRRDDHGPVGGVDHEEARQLWDGKIKPGFEMLVNNFSAGIAGAALAVVGFFAFGPVGRKGSRRRWAAASTG